MKRISACFAPSLLLCMLALTATAPTTRPAKAADVPAGRCEECLIGVQARYDQCLAQFGSDNDLRGQRCHDQFNEGISQCHRNFCEQ